MKNTQTTAAAKQNPVKEKIQSNIPCVLLENAVTKRKSRIAPPNFTCVIQYRRLLLRPRQSKYEMKSDMGPI